MGLKPKKKIAILGSTGSIGLNTCEVIRRLQDKFEIVGLAARANIKTIVEQAREFHPGIVALADEQKASALKSELNGISTAVTGLEGIKRVAAFAEADMVVSSIVGAAGLIPTIEAIKSGKNIALANKEVLVMAGEIVMRLARENGVKIIPIDSEHSALFQCLEGEKPENVRRIILTASGGPFLNKRIDELDEATPAQALKHPKWDMGNKVTIDSATMMNKGFEVIEAKWFFGIDTSHIEVIIHPQSIIHSMVEFVDGVVMAQLNEPDMKIPIQFALTYPNRIARKSKPFDFSANSQLTFHKPDMKRFPCIDLAYKAAEIGGTMPAVLSAANEVAVDKFLKRHILFTDIPKWIHNAMQTHKVIKNPRIGEILSTDAEIRKGTYL